LYSWEPKKSGVKGETESRPYRFEAKASKAKRADSLAKDEANGRIKKDIVKSVVLIGLMLALEIVIYLAWKRFLS